MPMTYSTAPARRLAENLEVWEDLADAFASTFPLKCLELSRWLKPADRVLDYGCGNGRAIRWFVEHGFSRVVGCDASVRMCAAARQRVPDIAIRWVSDPIEPNLGCDRLDAIVVVGVLSSVVPRACCRALVDRLGRALKPGGLLLIGDFGRSNDARYADRYAKSFEDGTFRTAEGLWIHHFDRQELLALLPGDCHVVDSHTDTVSTVHGNLVPGHVVVARRG